MADFSFMALGGGREIGANSFFYQLGSHGLLIDAGLHPEKVGWDAFPKLKSLGDKKIDSLVLTHAHTDHVGAIPYVLQKNDLRVLATKETIDISRVMLSNSASLLPKQHPWEVIKDLTNYSLDALDEVNKKFEPTEFLEPTSLNGSGSPKVTFYRSGHILGAAGLLIEWEGLRIFHTGDTSLHPQRLVAGAMLPDQPVDILVTESTNGLEDAYLTHSRELEIEKFTTTVRETLEGGGSVLIPVFALGKTQEVLAMLWDAMSAGKIPTVDIYTGGMGRKISEIYDMHKASHSRNSADDVLSEIPQKELPRRDGLFNGKFFKEPSIVLSASGMLQQGTASYFLAQRWLRQSNFTICFVGYTDPRTPGFVVSHAKQGERIRFGNMKRDVPVRGRVERFRFSAHARREELLSIVTQLKPKRVILTHGDVASMDAFSALIKEAEPSIHVSAPSVGMWESVA